MFLSKIYIITVTEVFACQYIDISLFFSMYHMWERSGQKLSGVEENVEQMSVGSRMAASRREEGRMRGQRWSRRRCNRTPELIACPAKDSDTDSQIYSYQQIRVQMSRKIFCSAQVGRGAS